MGLSMLNISLTKSFTVIAGSGATASLSKEATVNAFLGTFKYGATGLNCFRTKKFEFTYKPPGSSAARKKDHAFDKERKCQSTVRCNRAHGTKVQLYASKSVAIIGSYKQDEGKPSKLIGKGKDLVVEGKCKLDESVGVNTGKTCVLKMTDCEDASKVWLKKIIDAFGVLADTKGSYTLSSQKSGHCSGYGYCGIKVSGTTKEKRISPYTFTNDGNLPDQVYYVT